MGEDGSGENAGAGVVIGVCRGSQEWCTTSANECRLLSTSMVQKTYMEASDENEGMDETQVSSSESVGQVA